MDAIETWSDAARRAVTSEKQRRVVDVLARTRGGRLSVSAIAAEAGTTRDTVYKAFRLLHERGMLARHGKWTEPGEGLRGHVYTLVLPLSAGIDTAIDTGMVEPSRATTPGSDTGIVMRNPGVSTPAPLLCVVVVVRVQYAKGVTPLSLSKQSGRLPNSKRNTARSPARPGTSSSRLFERTPRGSTPATAERAQWQRATSSASSFECSRRASTATPCASTAGAHRRPLAIGRLSWESQQVPHRCFATSTPVDSHRLNAMGSKRKIRRPHIGRGLYVPSLHTLARARVGVGRGACTHARGGGDSG
jgi:hypothetical protein